MVLSFLILLQCFGIPATTLYCVYFSFVSFVVYIKGPTIARRRLCAPGVVLTCSVRRTNQLKSNIAFISDGVAIFPLEANNHTTDRHWRLRAVSSYTKRRWWMNIKSTILKHLLYFYFVFLAKFLVLLLPYLCNGDVRHSKFHHLDKSALLNQPIENQDCRYMRRQFCGNLLMYFLCRP